MIRLEDQTPSQVRSRGSRPKGASADNPYDRLQRLLCQVGGSKGSGTACLKLAGEHGLWGLVAALEMRPRKFAHWPQPRTTRTRSWFQRIVEWVRRRLGLSSPKEQPSRKVPKSSLDSRELAKVLADCQALSGRQNVAWCVPRFTPFWDDIPAELAGVSDKAIAWTLAARMIQRQGPGAFLRMPKPDQDAFLKRFQLDGHSPLGDALCLHNLLELLVQIAGRDFGVWPNEQARDSACPPSARGYSKRGGLRTEPFILIWWRLFLKDATDGDRSPDRLSEWCQCLQKLAAASPLTQAVYPDLVTPLKTREELKQTDLPELSRKLGVVLALPPEPNSPPATEENPESPPASKDFPEASQDSAPKNVAHGWRLHWLTVLARSMLGGILSPSFLTDRLECVEQELERVKFQLGFIKGKPCTGWRRLVQKRKVEELTKEQKRLEEKAKQLRIQDGDLKLARFMNLCALLGSPAFGGEGSASRTDQANRMCLKMRFLDMLIRHLASENMGRLEEQFHERTEAPAAFRRDMAMRSGKSELLSAFVQTLMGCSLDDLKVRIDLWNQSSNNSQGANPPSEQPEASSDRQGTDSASWLQMLLTGTFSLPFVLEDRDDCERAFEEWVQGSLLPQHEVRQLIDRFFHDGRSGIEVSFQANCPQSFAPGSLLESWMEILNSLFDSQESERLTVTSV